MKKIFKWIGIVLGVLVVLVILLIIFVPNSNKSFEEGKKAGMTSGDEKLTKDEERNIYIEAVAAEDRGMKEAEEQCPTNTASDELYDKWQAMNEQEQEEYLQECFDLQTKLSKEYRNEVLTKYSLNSEDWSQISSQAVEENWPLE